MPIVKEELTTDLQNVYDKLRHYESQAEAIKNAAEALKSDPAEMMTTPISEVPSKVRILGADQYVILDNKIPVLNPDAIQEKLDHQTEQAVGECVMEVGDECVMEVGDDDEHDEHHDIDPWMLPHVRSEFDPWQVHMLLKTWSRRALPQAAATSRAKTDPAIATINKRRLRNEVMKSFSRTWQLAMNQKADRIAQRKLYEARRKQKNTTTPNTVDGMVKSWALNKATDQRRATAKKKSQGLDEFIDRSFATGIEDGIDRGFIKGCTDTKEVRRRERMNYKKSRKAQDKKERQQSTEYIAAVKRQKARKDRDHNLVKKFHSCLIPIWINDNGKWVKEETLADSGSAISIARYRALKRTLEITGFTSQSPKMITVDGSPFDLRGSVQAQFAFDGEEPVQNRPLFSHPMHIAGSDDTAAVLGVDFWARYNAVFDFSNQEITMDNPSHTDEGVARMTVSMRTHRTVVEENSDYSDDDMVAGLSASEKVKTTCRADTDIYLQPWECRRTAIGCIIDSDMSKLNAHMTFEASAAVQTEELSHGRMHAEEDSDYDSEPEGTSEPPEEAHPLDNESGEEERLEGVYPAQDTMMDHYVHPIVSGGVARVYLPLANPSPVPLIIRRGQVYATLEEVRVEDSNRCAGTSFATKTTNSQTEGPQLDDLPESSPHHNKTRKELIEMVESDYQFHPTLEYQSWLEKVGPELQFGPRCNDRRADMCSKLLYAFSAVLAENNGKPGLLKGVEHKIELLHPDTEPRRCKTRTYSPTQMMAIRCEVEKMLENDIIERSDSPWAAPIVLVKKPDGSWRFCIDYRVTINPVCRQDSMPLPKIQNLLDKMQGAKELSQWDICSGYWSVLVRAQDRQYLAFNSETHGLMTFKRMPFGMSTSGATMQRAMEAILESDAQGPVLHEIAQIYSDDGTVFSCENDHLDDLTRVLKLLLLNNVTLKLKKCIWCTDQARMFGFDVRCGVGVAADITKVTAIGAMKTLDTVAALKSFLGSCVYLSRFIKDYAKVSAPLYALEATLRSPSTKLHPNHWGEDHERSFITLKAALASSPVLAFPDFSRPFILLTDASNSTIAGVLLQIDAHGIERPIAYASRRMNKAERNYGITDKEGLAGIYCTRKWRNYLLGHPSIWITDHSALTALRTKQEFDTQRLARYAIELQEFDLDIMHRPGRHCHIPDLLTRSELEEDPEIARIRTEELLRPKAEQLLKTRVEQLLTSPAERSLNGELNAYDEKEVQKHIRLLVMGAGTDGIGEPNDMDTLRRRVEHITEAMEAGTHIPNLGTPIFEECVEEIPRILEVYETICAAAKDVQSWSSITQRVAADSDYDSDTSELSEEEDEEAEAPKSKIWKTPSIEEIREAQARDPRTRKLLWHLIEMSKAEKLTKEDLQVQDRYYIKDEMLYYKKVFQDVYGNSIVNDVIEVPEEFTTNIIMAVHSSPRVTHRGVMTTYQMLCGRFHWPGMMSQSQRLIRACEVCQPFGNAPPTSGYGAHLKSNIPGEKWVTDMVYMEVDGKFEYVLTMVDICSRWVIARPMQNRSSEEVARTIVEMWHEAGVHFTPTTVVHDNGSEFKKTFIEVCHLLNVEQSWSIAGRPESHGVIEKFNHDFCQLLGKTKYGKEQRSTALTPMQPHEKRWSWILPHVTSTINSVPTRASSRGIIGFSPSEIFHGLQPELPLDRALQASKGIVGTSDVEVEDRSQTIRDCQQRTLEWAMLARQHYEKQSDEALSNRHKVLRVFNPGDRYSENRKCKVWNEKRSHRSRPHHMW